MCTREDQRTASLKTPKERSEQKIYAQKNPFNLWKKEKDMEDVEGAIEMPLFDIT